MHELSAFAPGFVAFPKSGSHAYFRGRLFERADSLKADGVLKHHSRLRANPPDRLIESDGQCPPDRVDNPGEMISRVALDSSTAEAPLAASIWADGIDPIYPIGASLDSHAQGELTTRGFRSMLVSMAAGPVPPELVSPPARAVIWTALTRAFTVLDGEPLRRPPPAATVARCASDLATACDRLIAELQAQSSLPTPAPTPLDARSRRTHDAINGAAVAVFTGLRLQLPATTLRDLAHGMLLRDFRQAPAALRAGSLRPDERLVVERHAEEAFEILYGLNWGTAAVRLVVQQHHERQDGSGYPGNLRGLHSVRRLMGQRFNRELMHPLAEVAGVADVFTALNADRPQRLALTPRAVAAELVQHGERSLSQAAAVALLEGWDAPRHPARPHVRALNLGGAIRATGITRLAS